MQELLADAGFAGFKSTSGVQRTSPGSKTVSPLACACCWIAFSLQTTSSVEKGLPEDQRKIKEGSSHEG